MKFMFYKSYFDSLSCIQNPADRWKVLDAIFKYMESGRTPKLPKILMSCFFLIKPIVDSEAKRMRGNPNFVSGKPNPYYEKRAKNSSEAICEGSRFEDEQNFDKKKIIRDNSELNKDYSQRLCDLSSREKSFEIEREIEREKEEDEGKKNFEIKKQAKKVSSSLKSKENLQAIESNVLIENLQNFVKNDANLGDIHSFDRDFAESENCDSKISQKKRKSENCVCENEKGLSKNFDVTKMGEIDGEKIKTLHNQKLSIDTSARTQIPPTIQDIQSYIDEKKLDVDAEAFFDFYESKDWFVGKNKMASFEASLRNWDRQKKTEKMNEKTKKREKFGFEQREYTKEFLDSLVVRDLDSIDI